MKYRHWHAQLDVFDAVRRYLALMSRWTGTAPNRERLFISDFYLVNPSLLHKIQMTSDVRKAFNALRIAKPEQQFVRLPPPAVLFHKMSGVQIEALHNLIGRGLCDVELVNEGRYALSKEGVNLSRRLSSALVLPREEPVIGFLTKEFLEIGAGDGSLRASTGLRRVGV
jgi:hypothetical protein